MNVPLDRLRAKLAPRFPDLEQVEEHVLRFERKSHDRAYAVCYVDTSPVLPDTPTSLNDYQERIVGARYFQGRKSLQWSHYLFFVVDVKPPDASRTIIERDRRYARKYVVTEPELDVALTPPKYKVSDAAIRTDILTAWTNLLADANLDRAILNDETMPRRLELIEEHFGQAASPAPRSVGTPRTAKQPFLRRVVLDKFRPFPRTRQFDLGTVTLLCGVNGSGKTSILEAIELVYCGHTKRNPKAAGTYSIAATYEGGRTESANDRRPVSVFRDRSLAWYGQFEQKFSNLYQTFGRFNFLNTDAAVGLAESKSQSDLEEDLSKLMVGPDASKTWDVIGRTAEKLGEKIKELQTLRNQVDQELMAVNRQIAASSGLKQESRAILQKLDTLLAEARWARANGDADASVRDLVESLVVYGSVMREAIKCDWADAPVTIDGLRLFVIQGRGRAEAAEKAMRSASESIAAERRVAQELSQTERLLSALAELLRYTERDFPRKLAEIQALAPLITEHARTTVGHVTELMKPHLASASEQSVSDFVNDVSTRVSNAQERLAEARQQYSQFSELREEAATLDQRLRDVASQILKTAVDPDVCPLCHFKYPQGELSQHMHKGVDAGIETRAAELLNAIRKQEAVLRESELAQSAAEWAALACTRLEQSLSISVQRLIHLVQRREEERVILSKRHVLLVEELAQLEREGLTGGKYQELLATVPSEVAKLSAEEMKNRHEALGRQRAEILTKLNATRTTSASLRRAAAESVSAKDESERTIEVALSQLKERLVTTVGVLNRLAALGATLPMPSNQSLSETVLTIETVRKVAGDYQATVSKEQSAISVLTEATKRKGQIEKQLAGLTPRIERISEARDVLATIQTEHSLQSAMDDALKQNRVAIEGIFSRIHSPAEFSGLGPSLTTLVRKGDGGTATLQQISTGQRAAFALSLFLAQNAQLRTAPPLILIDDPIAHVDDLNCLSFLDYLREVVVAGDRQVVFATANEKLATLFERKFDFLGESEYRRYDLSR